MRNTTWKRTGAVAMAVSGLLLLGACGDDGDDGDDDASGDTTEAPGDTTGGGGGEGGGITIEGFAFSEATAAAGSSVEITNADSSGHTVTSDDDAWESVPVGGSESAELTAPSEPGEYAYHCEIHTTMTATLVVE